MDEPEHADTDLPEVPFTAAFAPDDAAFPVFSDADLDELAEFGEEQAFAQGQVLFTAGEDSADFFVVLDGEVEIVRSDEKGGDATVVVIDPRRFVGELQILTGQRRYLTARMRTAGRLLIVPLPEFRRLQSAKPDLADTIFDAMLARREVIRTGDGAKAVRVIGSQYSAEAMALRGFAARAHLPYTWTDVEQDADAVAYIEAKGYTLADTPLVFTAAGTLVRPTPGAFAEHLGLTYHPTPGYIFDLVVIGTGPAGLAASVYGASEGLDTISLDSAGIGGQAGSSSRIENYAGFPNGISGEELATRTAIQAQRLGAALKSPCEVAGLVVEDGFHVVRLTDGSEIPCRAVIVASGARYQRLAVDDLVRFEGAGVYYAATDLEARACNGAPVVVVGGGNSAGQAALYLAKQGSRVTIAIRRGDLTATMSHYLIERIEADPRITLRTCTEVRSLAGDDHLDHVTLEATATGHVETVGCAGLFCFIGARAATGWLDGAVELDDEGFILTDRSLPDPVRASPAFATREPLPFETSVPGVFAVGDVRNGSLKRVAAAVGEGSSAVRSVFEHLASTV